MCENIPSLVMRVQRSLVIGWENLPNLVADLPFFVGFSNVQDQVPWPLVSSRVAWLVRPVFVYLGLFFLNAFW